MDKGNVSKHQSRDIRVGREQSPFSSARWGATTNSDISKPTPRTGIVEESKHGAERARQFTRGYSLDESWRKPEDRSEPEDHWAKRGPDWKDDTPSTGPRAWLRGMGPKQAEGKPGFDFDGPTGAPAKWDNRTSKRR